MQNWLVKTILLILTVLSLDTIAANQCVDLFSKDLASESEKARSEEFEYQQIQAVSDSIALKIKTLYGFKEKNTVSDQITKSLQAEFKNVYVDLVTNFLNKKNIEFKLIFVKDGPEEHLKDISYPVFIITPIEKKSKLNKYALGLHKVAGVGLIYSPAFNRANGFASAFIPFVSDVLRNAIILHENAILDGQFSDSRITPHEIKHALFQAERNGIYVSKIKAPVHGFYKNIKKISVTDKKPYQSFFSFEELVTYAYSITADAKKTLRTTSVADKISLIRSLEIMKSLSARSLEMSETALYYIEKMQYMVMDYDQSLSVKIDDDIKLVLQVPKSDLELYQKDPLAYAKHEFQKIKKLAEFNLTEIHKIGQSEKSDIAKVASNFRSNQIQMLSDLNSEKK